MIDELNSQLDTMGKKDENKKVTYKIYFYYINPPEKQN